MYCRIKYDLEENEFVFNFSSQDEIPKDIPSLPE